MCIPFLNGEIFFLRMPLLNQRYNPWEQFIRKSFISNYNKKEVNKVRKSPLWQSNIILFSVRFFRQSIALWFLQRAKTVLYCLSHGSFSTAWVLDQNRWIITVHHGSWVTLALAEKHSLPFSRVLGGIIFEES